MVNRRLRLSEAHYNEGTGPHTPARLPLAGRPAILLPCAMPLQWLAAAGGELS